MILTLFIILLILMSLIGKDRGAKSFLVLFLNTIVAIINIYLIGHGINALVIMILSSIFFSFTTIFLQNGNNVKSLASMTSLCIVILSLSIIVYFICTKAHINGFDEIQIYEEDNEYISSGVNLNMLNVLICSMIWGLLGAVADTSISISTTINEIHNNNKSLKVTELFKSGMSVGKDILGTTINTLVFVGLGESIMLALLYISYQYSFEKILNSKSFFQELSGIMISCIGSLLIIPITSIIFSYLIKSKKVIDYFDNKKESTEI